MENDDRLAEHVADYLETGRVADAAAEFIACLEDERRPHREMRAAWGDKFVEMHAEARRFSDVATAYLQVRPVVRQGSVAVGALYRAHISAAPHQRRVLLMMIRPCADEWIATIERVRPLAGANDLEFCDQMLETLRELVGARPDD